MKFNTQSNSVQTLWLACANFISFSFGIISAAILSRFLPEDEYGSYRQVLYVYSTLLVVFTLGLPRAYSYFLARLPLNQGKSAVSKINGLFLFIGLIFSLSLFFGASIIANVLNNPNLCGLIRWFSPTPIFLLPVLGIESVMATYKKASYATTYVILSRLFTLVCVVCPVMVYENNAKSAIIGFTISSMLCLIAGLWIERKPFLGIESCKSTLQWKELLIYSWPMLIASLWGVLYQSSPQFFISRWWGSVTFAQFSNGFIELPFASMIIGAVSTVLLPAFSKETVSDIAKGKAEILRLWKSSFDKSAMIIYPLAVFACIFATPIMDVLYGEKYLGSAIYFQIIILINLTRIIPFTPIMMALNRLKLYSRAIMISALFVVVFDFIYVSIFSAAWGIALIQCLAFIINITILLRDVAKCLQVRVKDLISSSFLLRLISVATLSVFCAYVVLQFAQVKEPLILLVIALVISALIYLPLSRFSKIDYKPLFSGFIKKA